MPNSYRSRSTLTSLLFPSILYLAPSLLRCHCTSTPRHCRSSSQENTLFLKCLPKTIGGVGILDLNQAFARKQCRRSRLVYGMLVGVASYLFHGNMSFEARVIVPQGKRIYTLNCVGAWSLKRCVGRERQRQAAQMRLSKFL